MTGVIRHAIASRDARAQAMAALLAGGRLCIYAGEAPFADEPVMSRQPLVEMRFSTFQLVGVGVVEAVNLAGQSTNSNAMVATWYRVMTSDAVPVFDGDVGVNSDDPPSLVLDDIQIRPGAIVHVRSFRYVVRS